MQSPPNATKTRKTYKGALNSTIDSTLKVISIRIVSAARFARKFTKRFFLEVSLMTFTSSKMLFIGGEFKRLTTSYLTSSISK